MGKPGKRGREGPRAPATLEQEFEAVMNDNAMANAPPAAKLIMASQLWDAMPDNSALPDFFAKVWGERVQQLGEDLEGFGWHPVELHQLVAEDHHRADRGVEAHALDVLGDLADRLMEKPCERARGHGFEARGGGATTCARLERGSSSDAHIRRL